MYQIEVSVKCKVSGARKQVAAPVSEDEKAISGYSHICSVAGGLAGPRFMNSFNGREPDTESDLCSVDTAARRSRPSSTLSRLIKQILKNCNVSLKSRCVDVRHVITCNIQHRLVSAYTCNCCHKRSEHF